MFSRNFLWLPVLAIACDCVLVHADEPPPFIIGADISWVQQQEAEGKRWIAQGVVFDILGQSYYPKWHGTLEDLKANLTDLAQRYAQPIIVVEYSVPNIRAINDIVRNLPRGKGLGTFIWEPTKWSGPALFDVKGNTKAEIDVYLKMVEDYRVPVKK